MRSVFRSRSPSESFALLAGVLALSAGGAPFSRDDPQPGVSLDETRITMGKWIETQQLISKERNEWTQGREILQSRLELVKKEVGGLEEKIQKAEADVARAEQRRGELAAQGEKLDADLALLRDRVAALESGILRLVKTLPAPVREKLDPLLERMPKDPAETRVTVPERFQNVLVILNEVSKANSEITVTYEVRTLASGKPSEVRVVYVGLGQAYYVSASGEAGVGVPTQDGWTWSPSKAVAGDVLTTLEILQGKHSPAFVPLPVRIR